MERKLSWAWFVLALSVVLFQAWLHRYEYAGCDLDGCVVIDRWSGNVYFEPLEEEIAPAGPGTVMVRS
jgi:hypothetical protein